MQNLLFSFADLSVKDKVVKTIERQFKRAGAEVIQTDINPSLKRASGVTYKELSVSFADSQTVVFRIKQTGDIFQALVNGKVLPIKNQDDHVKAIAEIVDALESGRTKFQKMLARLKTRLPPGIKTAAPRMIETLTQKRDELKSAIEEAGRTITGLQEKLAEIEGGQAASPKAAQVAPTPQIQITDSKSYEGKKEVKTRNVDESGLAMAILGQKNLPRFGDPFVMSPAQVEFLKKLLENGARPISNPNNSMANPMRNSSPWLRINGLDMPVSKAKAYLKSKGVTFDEADEDEDGYEYEYEENDVPDIALGDVVLDFAGPKYNPKTDHWVTTEKGSHLMIRGGNVVGGAGGKLDGRRKDGQHYDKVRKKELRSLSMTRGAAGELIVKGEGVKEKLLAAFPHIKTKRYDKSASGESIHVSAKDAEHVFGEITNAHYSLDDVGVEA
jgi:hypothetical protein